MSEVEGAYEKLDRAIERLRLAMDPDLKTILGDWVIVAAEYDIEQPNETTYSRFFRGGRLPYHVSIGLLETGIELTQEGGRDD